LVKLNTAQFLMSYVLQFRARSNNKIVTHRCLNPVQIFLLSDQRTLTWAYTLIRNLQNSFEFLPFFW